MGRLQSREHGGTADYKGLKRSLIRDAGDQYKLALVSTLLYAAVLFVTTIVSAIEQSNNSTNAELPHGPCALSGMSHQSVERHLV